MTKKSKSISQRSGYRQFMSGFAEYARENNIHIHGGRGSFARKAGEVWKTLKGKPGWQDNLDVILPPYLEGEEGGPAPMDPSIRLRAVVEEFATQQYEWWNIKNLFGLWSESINIVPDRDHLLINVDEDENMIELKNDLDAFSLYNAYRDMPENNDSNTASYLRFENAEINDNKGIDVTFISQTAEGFMKSIHTKTTFDWSQKVKEQYKIQKEAVGKKGAAKIARTRVNIRAAARLEAKEMAKPEQMTKIKASFKKLEQLNKAIDKYDSLYEKGVITKAEYRKMIKKLHKL